MSARKTRLTRDDAQLLVSLARKGAQLSDRRAGRSALRTFAEGLDTDPTFHSVATRSVHYLRLLRHALAVFGADLKRHLLDYGVAKVCRIAKLRAAKSIMKSGKIKLADGTHVALTDLTKKKLDLILLAAPLKSGERQARTPAPGDVFAVPRDVTAVRDLLLERLKSLRPRHPGVPPRYVMRAAKGADAPSPTALREHLRQLRAVINVYKMLVDELLAADLLEPQSRPFTLKVAGKKHTRPDMGRRIESTKLLKALRRLPDRS